MRCLFQHPFFGPLRALPVPLIIAILCANAPAQEPEPEPVDAHLPLITQEESPIRFDVKFWPTHILAGERVNMELTLRNIGREPFRMPLPVPEVYQVRINLYLDDPLRGPSHHENNIFYSALSPSTGRIWEYLRDITVVDPGESHTITSNHILAAAGGSTGADTHISQLESARIRTVIYLDDGTFVPADWVEFTIEQPDLREEDWRDDIVYQAVGNKPLRHGLLRQSVGEESFWFIASQYDGHFISLQRLPITEIRQVIPPAKIGDRVRNIAVLGTDAAGSWHYHGRLPPAEAQRGRLSGLLDLGPGKTWRLQLNNEDEVELIETQLR